jgi:hypothetical protein
LLLGTLRDETRPEKNAKAGGRLVIVGATSPIRVTKCIKGERPFGEEQAMVDSPFKVAEHAFSSSPMSERRRMHKLT